jgi:exoribonuclease-2
MTASDANSARSQLRQIAHRVMLAKGLLPDFSPEALAQLDTIRGPASKAAASVRDLRALLWCSIDNDDSRDLDQLSVAEGLPNGAVKVLVAIADVAAVVPRDSALDEHARQNTTSVYTAAAIFPMLPEKLSTDLTSLGFDSDRLAIVAEMTFDRDGSLAQSGIYQALVKNRAKLAYRGVGEWLEGAGPMPPAIGAVGGLEGNLRLQNAAALRLRALRHQRGALSLETIRARPVFVGDRLADLEAETGNQATRLIEDFMIAANGVAARYLAAKGFPSIRRVVRTPKHWDLIVALVAKLKTALPEQPDALALERFLEAAKTADPLHFPDLSLSVIKLMGAGEYVVEAPGATAPGHFGLAVRDYSHSTAPNRRFPDLLTQRLLKAALDGGPPAYAESELEILAKHCTDQEDAAKKVERCVAKSAAAMLLESKIGGQFDALVTGAADKGTWVRILHPPIEGRLVGGFAGRRVGDRLRVQLVHTDVDRGYIDFIGLA